LTRSNIKQIFQDHFFVSRAVYERAVLFGFSSLKKLEAEAVLFLVALPLPKKISRFHISDSSNLFVLVFF